MKEGSKPDHFNKGRKMSDETRAKISQALRGRKHTEETKLKIGRSNRGLKRSDEVRRKFSEDRKGKPLAWLSQSQYQVGVKHPPDCPHCEAVRKSNAARALDEGERKVRRRASGKRAAIKTRSGITMDDYFRMSAEQNGVCAICAKPCSTGKRLSVDHDHDTGAIRGLLCSKCNLGLGHFDLEALRKAVAYMEKASC